MNLLTSWTPGRKRQMILAPEINPNTFLFFFEKGSTGYSYSLRDYSFPHHVSERYAREFNCNAEQIRLKASCILDAPAMDIHRLADWHSYTATLNDHYGLTAEVKPVDPEVHPKNDGISCTFPVLDLADLEAHPKASKRADMRRILTSAQSEDRLTWNVLRLLQSDQPDVWWGHLATCASSANPDVDLIWTEDFPQLRFWVTVPSPQAYELASRARMRQSSNPLLVARSMNPQVVEGNSEIDVVIESKSLLIYVEAKLNADISMRTTYDEGRNQIVRNIDCLLESAGGRKVGFWMFVRDAHVGRAYFELMHAYRRNPEMLKRELPHRDPSVLEGIARNLTIITWREIGVQVLAPIPTDDDITVSVKDEIRRLVW